jgi:hypothetical protein
VAPVGDFSLLNWTWVTELRQQGQLWDSAVVGAPSPNLFGDSNNITLMYDGDAIYGHYHRTIGLANISVYRLNAISSKNLPPALYLRSPFNLTLGL